MAAILSAPFNIDQQEQDNMEITFEDIDFDVIADEPHSENEDEMRDDAPANTEVEDIELRSVTAEAEDYMIDDAQQDVDDNQDGVMIDEPQPEEDADEELLDFSDEEIGYDPSEHTPVIPQEHNDVRDDINAPSDLTVFAEQESRESPSAVETVQAGSNESVFPTGEDVDGTVTAHQLLATGTVEQVAVASPLGDSGEATAHLDISTAGPHDDSYQDNVNDGDDRYEAGQDEYTQSATAPSGYEVTEPATTVEDDSHLEQQHEAEIDGEDEGRDEQLDEVKEVVSLDRESPQSHSSDGNHTYTGLHTTIVKYDGGEYFLFPSSEPAEGEEYFLGNENLASGSIGDLLQACRITLGEAISDDEELEMHVEDLGLYLSEDSTAAFSASFSELLDIFVQLYRHDGIEQPPPLSITLTRKARFANRLSLLANAVASGKGMSQLTLSSSQGHDDHLAGEAYEQDDNGEIEPAVHVDEAYVTDTGDHSHAPADVEELAAHEDVNAPSNAANVELTTENDLSKAVENDQGEDTPTSRTLSPSRLQEVATVEDHSVDDDQHDTEHVLLEDDSAYEQADANEHSGDATGGDKVESIHGTFEVGDDSGHAVASLPSSTQQQINDGAAAAAIDVSVQEDQSAPSVESDILDSAKHGIEDEDEEDLLDFEDEAADDADEADETSASNKRSIDDVVEAESQDSKRSRPV